MMEFSVLCKERREFTETCLGLLEDRLQSIQDSGSEIILGNSPEKEKGPARLDILLGRKSFRHRSRLSQVPKDEPPGKKSGLAE